MPTLPVSISILFISITLLTLLFIWKAAHRSITVAVASILWMALQTVITLKGFYNPDTSAASHFPLLILPPMLLILILLVTKAGSGFIARLDLRTLTLLHIIRVPVEICLYLLSTYKLVPILMTFEGRNFDILSGLSAPVIWYWVFVRKGGNKNSLLVWNIICLMLLANIVINAILSVPSPFQQFAFHQPNVAILYFPFM